jgi:antitoxin MazE
MAMPVKVKKWGSSMAVLIPSQFAEMRKIGIGTVVDLEALRIVKPKRRRYKLAELLAGFKSRHRHGEWKPGDRVGKEVW